MGEIMKIPGFVEFNPMMLLHGEENLEIFKPIVPGQKYDVQEKVVDCQDKGKMTFLFIEAEIKNSETKELAAKVLSTIIIRGVGGFGHKGTLSVKYPSVP